MPEPNHTDTEAAAPGSASGRGYDGTLHTSSESPANAASTGALGTWLNTQKQPSVRLSQMVASTGKLWPVTRIMVPPVAGTDDGCSVVTRGTLPMRNPNVDVCSSLRAAPTPVRPPSDTWKVTVLTSCELEPGVTPVPVPAATRGDVSVAEFSAVLTSPTVPTNCMEVSRTPTPLSPPLNTRRSRPPTVITLDDAVLLSCGGTVSPLSGDGSASADAASCAESNAWVTTVVTSTVASADSPTSKSNTEYPSVASTADERDGLRTCVRSAAWGPRNTDTASGGPMTTVSTPSSASHAAPWSSSEHCTAATTAARACSAAIVAECAPSTPRATGRYVNCCSSKPEAGRSSAVCTNSSVAAKPPSPTAPPEHTTATSTPSKVPASAHTDAGAITTGDVVNSSPHVYCRCTPVPTNAVAPESAWCGMGMHNLPLAGSASTTNHVPSPTGMVDVSRTACGRSSAGWCTSAGAPSKNVAATGTHVGSACTAATAPLPESQPAGSSTGDGRRSAVSSS